ncbi:uncharacterized protein YukE [Amycolatopsis bartoniae]|uniref:PPE domain-containing protein n=1 Tax=Amycolatopsis bartoniae TaxID=941986 RepID=A0A8H9MGV4_9PSEU|nr:PPE domain-containing protein [Amycolatopsis bartoniae]MBB2934126.1 uncharacterized protein YukE [Amycolatopsis bartoniae]TVT05508.1 PPE domain-containing protein [Amycolatopsis bartoniae]GHF84169.1 hypothetical protein GCM10017566_67730 [Amycolatopsis bartoniae]
MTAPEHRRRHEYYSDSHEPTARQRRRIRRRHEARVRNRADDRFGKINWNAYDHQQLYDMVHTSDPAAMSETVQQWSALADRADAATARVQRTVQQLMESWRGGSAAGAAGSASNLTAWAGDAGRIMRGIGSGLATYTNAIVDARNAMPDPVHYTAVQRFLDGYDVRAEGPGAAILAEQLLADQQPTKAEADRAKAEAVRVMERYEATSKGVHDTLPSFATAPSTVVPPSQDAPSTPGTGSKDPSNRGSRGVDNLFQRASVPTGSLPSGGSAGSSNLDVTRPSSIRDLMAGNGSSGLAGGQGSAFGAGQEALSRGGLSGAGTQAGGGSFSGSLPTASGGGTGAGMYPGASTGRREDDRDHQNRYGSESGLDLLDDLPPACPPVIGE